MSDFLGGALAPDRWPTFVLITARIGGLMMSAPLWSMSTMPRSVRAAITVLLAVFLLPMAPTTAMPEQVLDLPLPVALEMVVGLAIGLTAAVFVQGVALAGEVVSIQMGLSLGPALSPTADLQTVGIGQLQGVLAMMIYLAVGGHLMLLRGLADSLQSLPPGTAINFGDGGAAAAMMLSTLFSAAVRAAAPVLVTLLLVNVALAILSRAVPQLNAMMVSLPISIAVGLVMAGVSMPVVAATVESWMHALPESVEATVQSFKPAVQR